MPALLVVVLIRLDAKLIGPYFSTGELLPSFGYGPLEMTGKGTLRFALIRRLVYPIILGIVLYALHSDVTMALVAGLMTGFLLAWPAWIAPNPPMGVSFRDGRYHLFYFGIILSGGTLTLGGWSVAALIGYFSEGEIFLYLAENIFMLLLGVIGAPVIVAYTSAIGKSLSEKAQERERRFNEAADYDPDDEWFEDD